MDVTTSDTTYPMFVAMRVGCATWKLGVTKQDAVVAMMRRANWTFGSVIYESIFPKTDATYIVILSAFVGIVRSAPQRAIDQERTATR